MNQKNKTRGPEEYRGPYDTSTPGVCPVSRSTPTTRTFTPDTRLKSYSLNLSTE